jgi:hypothetical protein
MRFLKENSGLKEKRAENFSARFFIWSCLPADCRDFVHGFLGVY